MHWVNAAVIGLLVAADALLILELRAARKEMRAVREGVPRWVGLAIAANVLVAAVNRATRKTGEK
jgi:hypothetical protein